MTRPGKWTDLIAQAAALNQGESLRVQIPIGRDATRWKYELRKMLIGAKATRTSKWSVKGNPLDRFDRDYAVIHRFSTMSPAQMSDLEALQRVKRLIEEKIYVLESNSV